MTPEAKKWSALCVLVLLYLAGALVMSYRRLEPKLILTYLGTMDDEGQPTANFRITNTGNGVAVAAGGARIELEGSGVPSSLAGRPPEISYLQPGQSDTVSCVLPNSLTNRWRVTFRCAHQGLRSRIYQMQWGPNGLGAKVNWMVPRSLKGVPLDVTTTSDWISRPMAFKDDPNPR